MIVPAQHVLALPVTGTYRVHSGNCIGLYGEHTGLAVLALALRLIAAVLILIGTDDGEIRAVV
jgi:hypothetical protein